VALGLGVLLHHKTVVLSARILLIVSMISETRVGARLKEGTSRRELGSSHEGPVDS